MCKQINYRKRVLSAMLSFAIIISAVFVPGMSIFSSATTFTSEELGIHKDTVIDFNDATDISDYTAAGTTPDFATQTISDGKLSLKDSNSHTVMFDVYSNIKSYSMDVKVTELNSYFPQIIFFKDDANNNCATFDVQKKTDTTFSIRTQGNAGDTREMSEVSSSFDWTKTWVTITVNYGEEVREFSDRNYTGKYIESIVLTDRETKAVLLSYIPNDDYHKYWASYGVNSFNNTTAVDSEKVKIGFKGTCGMGICIDNITVKYRNVPTVIKLINNIGTVLFNQESLVRIEKAEQAFDFLSSEDQSNVTNYATLTSARLAYNSLAENADVANVIRIIGNIGTVDGSADSLTRINAAQQAYDELSSDLKRASVTNYSVLCKAYDTYNYIKYGVHGTEVINFNGSNILTDYTGVGTIPNFNTQTILDNSLILSDSSLNHSVMFDAYSNIKSYSVDVKLESLGAYLPTFVFFKDDANSNCATFDIQKKTDTTFSIRTKGNAGDTREMSGVSSSFDWTKTWVTITVNYGDEVKKFDDRSYTGKYLESIVMTDRETGNVLLLYSPSGDYQKYWASYGANSYIDNTAVDSENMKVGFLGSSDSTINIDNLKIIYRNVTVVNKLISEIGTVTYSDNCLEKIEKAEGAYALLSDEDKDLVSEYSVLTAARLAYNNLSSNADVNNVVNLINSIGQVDGSDNSLAKINSAQQAYDELSSDSKRANVKNYYILRKAYNTYNYVKYGVHGTEVIDFNGSDTLTDYTSVGTTPNFNIQTISDGSLTLSDSSLNHSVMFDAYSNIKSYSVDVKLESLGAYLPTFVFFKDDANNNCATFDIQKKTDTTFSIRTKGNAGDTREMSGVSSSFDWTKTWVTITVNYGDEIKKFDDRSYTGKYLESIVMTDRETGNVLLSYSPSGDYQKYWASYGVNTFTDSTAVDSNKVKIGFCGESNSVMDIDNLTFEYRNASIVKKIVDEIGMIDSSNSSLERIEKAKGAYELLPEIDKISINYNFESAEELHTKATSITGNELPQIIGATVREKSGTADQNLRFTSLFPTKVTEGYKIVGYGTVMIPKQLLNEELTLSTDSIAKVYNTVNESDNLEETSWNSELQGISVSGNACSVAIAARSFIVYSNGTNQFIVYSKNPVSNPISGVPDGVCMRSVFSTARSMATALLNTQKYSAEQYGSIYYTENVADGTVDGSGSSIPSGSDVLAFVYRNRQRLNKIAQSQNN